MRTFIALDIPDTFRFETAGLARQLAGTIDGRFTPPENYHVTLAFLGDVDGREVGLAMEAIEEACANRSPVKLASDGLGKFGKAGDATLWLGIRADGGLGELASDVRKALEARGVAFDGKPFKAHLTLARRANVSGGTLPALPFPAPSEALTVTLYKSELSADGPTYTPLHRCHVLP